MRDQLRIIDADRHVIEPMEMWRQYLDPQFRDRAPYLERLTLGESLAERRARLGDDDALVPLAPELMVDNQPVLAPRSERTRIELAKVAVTRAAQTGTAQSASTHLAAMDHEGIDEAYFYPTVGSFLLAVDTMDAKLAAAFARAYNNWLRDFCDTDAARLHGVGLISRHDPHDMISELLRVSDFGWRAVVLRPNPVKGRPLGHPDYEPFWRLCAERSVAVSIHEGTHSRLPTTGSDRFESRFAQHACAHAFEQMMAFLSLLEAGVLERHPSLRFAFLEAGAGWLPYWLWRLDEVEYAQLAGEVRGRVAMKPSEYFKRQCFVSIEPEEPNLAQVIDTVGADCLLFGSDFPHFDHDLDILDTILKKHQGASTSWIDKMLSSNPERFYGPKSAPTGQRRQQRAAPQGGAREYHA